MPLLVPLYSAVQAHTSTVIHPGLWIITSNLSIGVLSGTVDKHYPKQSNLAFKCSVQDCGQALSLRNFISSRDCWTRAYFNPTPSLQCSVQGLLNRHLASSSHSLVQHPGLWKLTIYPYHAINSDILLQLPAILKLPPVSEILYTSVTSFTLMDIQDKWTLWISASLYHSVQYNWTLCSALLWVYISSSIMC